MQKFCLSFFSEKDIQIVCFPVDHGADGHDLALRAIENHISLADQIAHIRVDFKTGAERRAGLGKLLEAYALGKNTVRDALGCFRVSVFRRTAPGYGAGGTGIPEGYLPRLCVRLQGY